MARPHPDGPLVGLAEVQTVQVLSMLVADAAHRYRLPGEAPWRTGVAAAEDGELREAWKAASDGGRRDVMTAVAEAAARSGFDPAGFEPPDDAAVDVYLAARYAYDLHGLATEELGVPGRDPTRSLLPDAPWEPALGPTGIYAMGVVCDSSEPETAKLAAAVALSAAAHQPGGTPS